MNIRWRAYGDDGWLVAFWAESLPLRIHEAHGKRGAETAFSGIQFAATYIKLAQQEESNGSRRKTSSL